MSEPRELPQTILVAGVGQVGALAALALKQAVPGCDVLIAGEAPRPDAFADHAITSLPFTNRLHDRLGVDEDSLVRRCGASHRLVTRYVGWGAPEHEGIAAYGAAIDPAFKTTFAREWGGGPRNAQTGTAPGSLAEMLAATGRFARPTGEPGSSLGDVDYSLRWNGPAYRQLLAELARQAGVRHLPGPIAQHQSAGPNGIAAISVGGAIVDADLYIDCSGPAAVLARHSSQAERIDWSDQLPTKAVLQGPTRAPVLVLEDTVAMTPAGWLVQVAGRDGLHSSLGVAEGADLSEVEAVLGGQPVARVLHVPGRATQAWRGNVIALGDSFATLPPLGWLNLDLAHRQLALLLELLPGRTMDPLERAEFNRRSCLMADRARDTVAAHFLAPAARSLFGPLSRSTELERALDQFERRGRTPFEEEMPLQVQEWASLLGALGISRGTGPLASADGDGSAAQRFRAKAETALRATPSYKDWLTAALGSRESGA